MELNKIDFNKLNVFCQVMDSGTYRRASEVLGVTPSALSQSIAALEHSLGFALFDRVGRRLVPTRRGELLHREFRGQQRQLLAQIEALSPSPRRVAGTLRIGAYLEFAKSQLSPLLKNFIREHPDVQIKMIFDTPSRLQLLLEEGHLDLCFSIFPGPPKKSLLSEKIYEEELVLIAPRQGLLSELSRAAVLQAPLLDYYASHQTLRRWLDLHYGKSPKRIPVRIYAATAEMLLALVREGAGIGVLPYYLVEAPEIQKQLRLLRPTPKKLKDYIWLLERNREEKSPLHQAFRQRVRESFQGGIPG